MVRIDYFSLPLGSSVTFGESKNLLKWISQMKLQVHAHAVEIRHAHTNGCTSNGTSLKRISSSPSQALRY